MELDGSVFHGFYRGLCKLVHLHEPLFAYERLYRNIAAFGIADTVVYFLDLVEKTEFF
jgi:hypothetical protein